MTPTGGGNLPYTLAVDSTFDGRKRPTTLRLFGSEDKTFGDAFQRSGKAMNALATRQGSPARTVHKVPDTFSSHFVGPASCAQIDCWFAPIRLMQ
jgi:hypothetical protein